MAKNDNLTDFLTDVANAIREKKGTSNLINPQNFSDEIRSIESGGSGWQPNEDMKWAKQVCENDVQEGFTYKVLQMISDGYVYTDIVVPSGGAVKTSDGGYYTENAKHTWNDTNSRVATSYSNMKLRWLIYYYTSDTPSITLLQDVMYACFDGMKFGTIFGGSYIIEYFDIINGANFNTIYTSMSYMFSSCSNLKAIPQLDTSSVTNMSNMFSGCYSLQTISLLDTSSVTNMSGMFSSCSSLQIIPLLDTSSVTNMSNMFDGCRSLQSIPLLDTSSVTNMNNMFSGCKTLLNIPPLDTHSVTDMSYMFSGDINSLIKIPTFDTSSVTNFNNFAYYCRLLQSLTLDLTSTTSISQLVYGCNNLEFLTLTNIKYNLNISTSKKFSQETLEALIDNLVDLTGQTAQKFTMGSTNLAKVSQEKKDLATSKNWSLN